jgi:hypothetical protein
LRVAIHEDAGDGRIDADEFFADPARAINLPEQALKVVVRDRALKFRERFPVRRVSERMARVIGGEGEPTREKEKKEEERPGGTAKDHGFDFELFNTMLARW